MRQTRTLSSSVSLTRRGFLRLGAGSVAAWTLAGPPARAASSDFRCIFLNLVGGPSHLDTWDPKPHAPVEFRGPFRPIRTKVPGVSVTELFPRLASILNRVTLVRSVYHEEAPIHEAGLQLLQTGWFARQVGHLNHVGTMLHRSTTASMLLPRPLENTGVQIDQGQGLLISQNSLEGFEARELAGESGRTRERYGNHEFGRSCLLARRLIENRSQCVAVNMFDRVYDSLSWDCHHDGGSLNVSLQDYRDKLAPMFDQTYAALILDLEERGLLNSTLVIAAGEFGRSPRINLRGGRDHWTGAWTVLLAGGGMPGGHVIGSTDRLGREPQDHPVHASAIANTILHAAGLPWKPRYRDGAPLLPRSATTA